MKSTISEVLENVRAREDLRQRARDTDPVQFVHRYTTLHDRELVGLVAASLAFGNVKAIRLKVEDLLARIGPSPSKAADDPKTLARALKGFVHRTFRGEDVAKLFIGARRVQRDAGSLGAAFKDALAVADREHEGHDAMREALASFCDRIRRAGGLEKSHLLSDTRKGSAAKRLLLYLRWMMRPADGIDLGLWDVPASRLLMPVDVHIHKLSRNLGFTRRNDLSWKTAVEITTALARFDANDPTRYDFSLCHMGMVQRCPSKRDEARCEGCGVKPVCIHWAKNRKM